MVVLLAAAFSLRVLWLDRPSGALIGDETWYVSAARAILALPQPPGAHYAQAALGRDPNAEHPPLGKLLIAAGMAVLGDDAWGWRLPSVLASVLAVAFQYRLCRAAGLGGRAAAFAAFLLAFDALAFVLGRIATLDAFVLLGLLAGATWTLERRPLLGGLAFALGTLCKETGIIGPAMLAAYAALAPLVCPEGERGRPVPFDVIARMLASYLACLLLAWWALDLRWTAFPTPFAHLGAMLADQRAAAGLRGPVAGASPPWLWLANEAQVPLFTAGADVPSAGRLVHVLHVYFRGALNPFLIMLAPLSLGAAAMLARRGDRPATLALVWAAAAYLPFVAIALAGRFTFLTYALPLVPALALATARVAALPQVPRALVAVYAVAVAYGFAVYFPFVGFRCC